MRGAAVFLYGAVRPFAGTIVVQAGWRKLRLSTFASPNACLGSCHGSKNWNSSSPPFSPSAQGSRELGKHEDLKLDFPLSPPSDAR